MEVKKKSISKKNQNKSETDSSDDSLDEVSDILNREYLMED